MFHQYYNCSVMLYLTHGTLAQSIYVTLLFMGCFRFPICEGKAYFVNMLTVYLHIFCSQLIRPDPDEFYVN